MDSTQFATQLGRLLDKAVLQGTWMAVVMLWGIFLTAWPAFLFLGIVAVVSRRL